MAAKRYTKDDLWVKEQLEKLFWIEIAKRKAHLWEPQEMLLLGELRRELEAFFVSEGQGLDEPVDYGATAILDAVEFNHDLGRYASGPDQLALLQRAREYFEAEVCRVSRLLAYHQGFSLADFSIRNDLQLLYEWWTFISSVNGRKKLGTEKSMFATLGKPRLKAWSDDGELVDTHIPTITSLNCPVSVPSIVHDRPFDALTTDECSVIVNDYPLTNQLVLVFDLSKPLPPMRLVEMRLRSTHGLMRARRNWEMIQAGQMPDELLQPGTDESRFDITRLLMLSPEEHRLMKGPSSPTPLILGLYSWDLVFKDGLKSADAYRCTVQDLIGELDADALDSQIRNTRYALKKVRPLIEGYEPSDLPWLRWPT